MKTKEELNAIKEEYENVNKKLAELSEDELKAVTGGLNEHDEMILSKAQMEAWDLIFK